MLQREEVELPNGEKIWVSREGHEGIIRFYPAKDRHEHLWICASMWRQNTGDVQACCFSCKGDPLFSIVQSRYIAECLIKGLDHAEQLQMVNGEVKHIGASKAN